MAINIETTRKKIFKLLKGYGHSLQLFTDEGNKIINPAEASRFFITDEKMMINLNTLGDENEITVNVGSTTDINDVRPMLDALRDIATLHMIGYSLRTFGKEITPRDFEYQAQEVRSIRHDNGDAVLESFSSSYGSTKSSYQQLDNARLIIRHAKKVDEGKRGARSRNIHSMFVENSDGERFKLPVNNLQAGRAMTMHVRHGGTPYDAVGKHIISLAEEHLRLQTFKTYAKQNSLLGEGTSNVYEGITARVNVIKDSYRRIASTRGYKQFVESFDEADAIKCDEELKVLQSKLGSDKFSDVIAEALPHVARIVSEQKQHKIIAEKVKKLVNKVISGSQCVSLSEEISTDDPDHPDNTVCADDNEWIKKRADYFSEFLSDSELRTLMCEVSAHIKQLSENEKTIVKKVLTFISEYAIVGTTTTDNNNKSVVTESIQLIRDTLTEFLELK